MEEKNNSVVIETNSSPSSSVPVNKHFLGKIFGIYVLEWKT